MSEERNAGVDGPAPGSRPSVAARTARGAVRWYQVWISPTLLPSCRFQPSCSAYAVDAFTDHGFWHGFLLTTKRLLRCGPWHPGGWDPVPPRRPLGSEPTGQDPDEGSTDPSPTERLPSGADR